MAVDRTDLAQLVGLECNTARLVARQLPLAACRASRVPIRAPGHNQRDARTRPSPARVQQSPPISEEHTVSRQLPPVYQARNRAAARVSLELGMDRCPGHEAGDQEHRHQHDEADKEDGSVGQHRPPEAKEAEPG